MDFINVLGLIAGSITTASLLPQIIKTWRSRSAKDISLGMFVLFSLGIILWIVYGYCIRAWPVIVTNMMTLVLTGLIIFFKIRFKE